MAALYRCYCNIGNFSLIHCQIHTNISNDAVIFLCYKKNRITKVDCI